MKPEDLEIEQYRALRAEILLAMEAGDRVMAFGLAMLGLVASVAAAKHETLAGFLLFAVAVPALSVTILSMWFATHERIARASHFLSGVEARLKTRAESTGIVTWECWLREGAGIAPRTNGRHFWTTEYSGILLVAILAFGSVMLGAELAGPAVEEWVVTRIVTSVVVALVLIGVGFSSRVTTWQNHLKHPFGQLP